MSVQRELAEQIALFDFIAVFEKAHPALRWVHASLNGVATTAAQAGKMKAAGMRSGVWDVFIPARGTVEGPDGSIRDAPGLYIEMKTPDNTTTTEQDAFRRFVVGQGYATAVAYQWTEAARFLVDYLDITDPRLIAALAAIEKGTNSCQTYRRNPRKKTTGTARATKPIGGC